MLGKGRLIFLHQFLINLQLIRALLFSLSSHAPSQLARRLFQERIPDYVTSKTLVPTPLVRWFVLSTTTTTSNQRLWLMILSWNLASQRTKGFPVFSSSRNPLQIDPKVHLKQKEVQRDFRERPRPSCCCCCCWMDGTRISRQQGFLLTEFRASRVSRQELKNIGIVFKVLLVEYQLPFEKILCTI